MLYKLGTFNLSLYVSTLARAWMSLDCESTVFKSTKHIYMNEEIGLMIKTNMLYGSYRGYTKGPRTWYTVRS